MIGWPTVPYLDCLRPEPGWRVERAVVATYSADLGAVVATMLALAGLDDDRGSGSKVDFANAHERLRGRFRVVSQKGRIGVPRRKPGLAAIMDTFIREVDANEEDHSFHCKCALVECRSELNSATQWRLWIGSKNLTKDLSVDSGLFLLSSDEAEQGVPIKGIDKVGGVLAKLAGYSEEECHRWARDLRLLRWLTPAGVAIEEISLSGPELGYSGFPARPDDVKVLMLISPFLDAKALKHFGKWGDKSKRYLLSNLDELVRVHNAGKAGLDQYSELLTMPPPAPDLGTPVYRSDLEAREAAEEAEDEEQVESQGLHAKVVAVKDARGWQLWLGSANATERAWFSNYELTVKLRLSERIGETITTFCEEHAKVVTLAELSGMDGSSETEEEKTLERVRKRLVGRWQKELRRAGSVYQIISAEPPPIAEEGGEILLSVSLLGGASVPWPTDYRMVELFPGALEGETEFVSFELELEGVLAKWLERVPLNPPPSEDRDRRALARHMDHRTFLAWIRGLLGVSVPGDGGGDWEVERSANTRRETGPYSAHWIPTIEEILKAWACDQDAVRDADKKVRKYLQYFRTAHPEELTVEDNATILEFEEMWELIQRSLLNEEAAG